MAKGDGQRYRSHGATNRKSPAGRRACNHFACEPQVSFSSFNQRGNRECLPLAKKLPPVHRG
ncbi:MAG TPA: hypothetical protein VGR48_08105, partial [Terriglobales bacterium]|nr:hypothetical protein [Terriglobales bacterium]